MDSLIANYAEILQKIDFTKFETIEDKYSGVFLPIPFDEYWQSEIKVMLIGRETSGWNTDNNKNTINRISQFVASNDIHTIIKEATNRYKNHLQLDQRQNVITKSKSRFKQYYFQLSKELNIHPKAIFYTNLFAWDYNKKTPLNRPTLELQEIKDISNKLLAAQINHIKPDYIIFATGVWRIDSVIKSLFNEHFDGYQTIIPVISGKLWEFVANNTPCFRIAHPRAMKGHQKYRKEVINRIQDKIKAGKIKLID
ncbi:hypothetical protein ACVWU7_001266 [Providencia stuartii]